MIRHFSPVGMNLTECGASTDEENIITNHYDLVTCPECSAHIQKRMEMIGVHGYLEPRATVERTLEGLRRDLAQAIGPDASLEFNGATRASLEEAIAYLENALEHRRSS